MQITINVSDKQIKSAINELLDNEIFDQYDKALIKEAHYKKSVTANDIFECAQFQERLAKALRTVAQDAVEDSLYETVCYDVEVVQVTHIMNSLDKMLADFREKQAANREAEEVKRMVKTLEKAGFKIVKA
jgi:hypothetical protein